MEIRLVKKSELEQAAKLANIVFCNDENGHMGSCFPTLFQAGIPHSYGAFSPEGNLVSFMGMVPVEITIGAKKSLRAYSIGAVCTDPAFRGQGLASKLLASCRQHAQKSGASVMFISGDRSLYTREGSVFFGTANKVTIKEDAVSKHNVNSSLPSWNYRDIVPEDIFTLHHLLTNKSSSFQWGITELQQSIGTSAYATLNKKIQITRIAYSDNNEIAAAIILMLPGENTPVQEQHMGQIIEWAGNPLAAYELMYDAISRYQLASLSAILPWQDSELIELLQNDHVQSEKVNNAGTVLVVDEAALIQQAGFDKTATGETYINILGNNRYELHTKDEKVFIKGIDQLSSVIFNPDTVIDVSKSSSHNPFAIPLPYMYGLYFI